MWSGSGSGYGNRYGLPPATRWTSGRWMTGSEYARMRACDEDRERTADVLRTAFVEGRLSQDELDERLGLVYTSRTYADLATQTADLPVQHPLPVLRPPSGGYRPTGTNGLAIGSFVCALLELFTFGLTAVPAVILGHGARRQIRRTGQHGDGMATFGLILGWLGIATFTLIVVAVVAVSFVHGGQVTNAHP
jgi:Domain of unknown function (DUF4190)/Domain of unknown function (DUF1707)